MQKVSYLKLSSIFSLATYANFSCFLKDGNLLVPSPRTVSRNLRTVIIETKLFWFLCIFKTCKMNHYIETQYRFWQTLNQYLFENWKMRFQKQTYATSILLVGILIVFQKIPCLHWISKNKVTTKILWQKYLKTFINSWLALLLKVKSCTLLSENIYPAPKCFPSLPLQCSAQWLNCSNISFS